MLCTCCSKSVINWTWLLLSISDWPIIMIGPCGLLLVVPPTYLLSQFQFLWMRFKKWISKLGCEKYFLQGHTYSPPLDMLFTVNQVTSPAKNAKNGFMLGPEQLPRKQGI
jgi:hypothetical protein